MKQACSSVKLCTDPRQQVPLSCVVISVYGTYNKRVKDTTMKSIIRQTLSSVLPTLSRTRISNSIKSGENFAFTQISSASRSAPTPRHY
jgi:hypothetical protein